MPIPGIGHAFPMVPTAWAFLAAGHDAVFLAGNDAFQVRNAGIPVVNPIPGTSMEEGMPAFLEDAPGMFDPMAHMTIEEILAMKPMVVQPWDRYVDAYVACARRLAPDLIFCDPMFASGLVSAALLDVPAIVQSASLVRFTPEFLFEHAAPAFERHGVGLPRRRAHIDVGQPSLLEPGPTTWRMRWVPYNGGGELPSWLVQPARGPRIALTLGTTMPRVSGAGRIKELLKAASGVPAEFALTMSEGAAAALGPLPENVRATGWVPLYELLRTCTAIVHHGGGGTTFTSCAAGIPQLVIPEGADTDYNARIIEAHGCGLLRREGQVDGATLRALLSDELLKTAARELRGENEMMPTPADLVGEIVELARSS